MYDTDQPRQPADHQHSQSVPPGLLQLPVPSLVIPVDQVDSLQDVRHSVSQADGDVEEDDLEDHEGAEGAEDGAVGGEACSGGVHGVLAGVTSGQGGVSGVGTLQASDELPSGPLLILSAGLLKPDSNIGLVIIAFRSISLIVLSV